MKKTKSTHLDAFFLSRQNRKARKVLKMKWGYTCPKILLMNEELDYALKTNGGVFPPWTRKEEKFLRYMAVPCGGC